MYVLCVYFNFRHMEYMKHGLKHMQLEFYIEGSEPGLKGTVHVDSKEVVLFIFLKQYLNVLRTLSSHKVKSLHTLNSYGLQL